MTPHPWPPPCHACDGDPASVDYCPLCDCEGTAVEWQCAACTGWYDVDTDQPAVTRTRDDGEAAYTCAACHTHPTLPGVA